MRYDNVPPAIIRRVMTVWLKNGNDATPVLFRIPDVSDEPPYYILNWFTDDQNIDEPYLRIEQISVNCVDSVDGDIYGVAAMKTKAMDFFQRITVVDDFNKFITYMKANGEDVPFYFKYFEISGGSDEVTWERDALTLESEFFVRYAITYDQESISKISSLSNSQIGNLDT